MIRIIRGTEEWEDGYRPPLKLYINGVYKGAISENQVQELEVENGIYVITAKVDWFGSNKLKVTVEDSIVEVDISQKKVEVDHWMQLLTIAKNSVIQLTERKSSDDVES